jgi:hypothetical protein
MFWMSYAFFWVIRRHLSTFRNTPSVPSSVLTYLPMKMGQCVPKCWRLKYRHWWITQKKAYNRTIFVQISYRTSQKYVKPIASSLKISSKETVPFTRYCPPILVLSCTTIYKNTSKVSTCVLKIQSPVQCMCRNCFTVRAKTTVFQDVTRYNLADKWVLKFYRN